MMPNQNRRKTRGVQRKHVKEIGILPSTLKRYHKAIDNFFRYLHDYHRPLPMCVEDLDYEASEFINHLWSYSVALVN